MASEECSVEWCVSALIILHLEPRTRVQKQRARRLVAVQRRAHERRDAVVVHRVDGDTGGRVEQGAEEWEVAAACRTPDVHCALLIEQPPTARRSRHGRGHGRGPGR